MNKKVYEAVKKRSDGLCEICGSNQLVEVHHIIHGKGKRNPYESIESCIDLCWNHHKGNNGVHGKNGSELDIKLKRELQDKYSRMGYTEDQVREKMGGKLY
jgi:hypothetical protein